MAEQNEKKAAGKAKVPDKAKSTKPVRKKDGFLKKTSRFFRDLRSEMKKVVWPSKKQVLNNTAVAFVMMGSVGIVIWVLDWVLSVIRGLVL